LTPCCPRAGPTGGAGVALPAVNANFTNALIFFAIMFLFFYFFFKSPFLKNFFPKLWTNYLNILKN
jgi:hypothetical protein